MAKYVLKDKVPLPPPDAKMVTTACDYCIVGCGYKAYTWPVGKEGGPKASQNAVGVDFPSSTLGAWISPNQHNIVSVEGKKHHVVVRPDPKATVVNVAGNHSIRGGTLALKCYSPDTPTADRLQHPMLRVNGKLTPVDWDTALEIMAAVSKHVIDTYGEAAWAMKSYSYQYFENTYAISKLAFGSIQTPAYAPHDKPGPGADTGGVDWAGIDAFSASYKDWSQAEVIFISGTDPYETKTVLFTSWMMGKPKLIMVLPRKTTGSAYAEATGGLFLQVTPGTDSLLHMAMARYILEQGWEDKDWIKTYVSNEWEVDSGMGRGTRNTPWQWATTWGKLGNVGFEGYKQWLLGYKYAEMKTASEITGMPQEQIKKAAEMLAKPKADGSRVKASFALEKGNYWSQNWVNTASLSSLALLCGAGNRPGQVVSRLGGHQRGWYGAADYPMASSPMKLPGRRKQEIDLDRWVEAGQVRFAWVIGTTWTAAMGASHQLAETFRGATRGNPHQLTSTQVEAAIQALKERVDSGGMVVVWQNIYLQPPVGTELADIILPAATWGEDDLTRCNGERRLRLYSKFYDPPGEAKPDWWIIGRFAKKMGFKGYDWQDSNQVFEEAARFGRGGVLNYHPLVWLAKKLGKKGHELLRELGTTGIQTPIRYYTGPPPHDREYLEYAGHYDSPQGHLVGTLRLHDPTLNPGEPQGPSVHQKWLTAFGGQVGKAVLLKSPWEEAQDFYEAIKPDPSQGELWISNGRINEIWQSDFDDRRKPYLKQRWPAGLNFAEVHPEDAKRLGLESGDEVRLWSDKVFIQSGGFVMPGGNDYRFSELKKRGLIRVGKGEVKAIAMVTDAVKSGVIFTYFMMPEEPANALVHRVPDPLTLRYRFKLSAGRVEKIGESPFKTSFEEMTFKPRTLMPV